MAGNDLVATMSMDTSDFVGPIERATQTMIKSGDQTIRVIHEQQRSWTDFGLAVLPVVTDVGIAVVDAAIAAEQATVDATVAAAQMGAAILQSAAAVASLTVSMIELGTMAVKTGIALGSLVVNTGVSVTKTLMDPSTWEAAGSAILKYGGITASVVGTLIPPLSGYATIIKTTILTINLATAAATELGNRADVSASLDRVNSAASRLGESLSRPFENASQTLSVFMERSETTQSIIDAFGSFTAARIDEVAQSIDLMTAAMDFATDGTTALMLAVANGDWTMKQVGALYNEAAALREVAKETERVIALQESQRETYKTYAEIKQNAELKAQQADEIASINAAKTVEEINNLRYSYDQLFSSQMAGLKQGETFSGQYLAHIAAIHNAITNQEHNINSGRVTAGEEMFGGGSFGEEPAAEPASINGSNAASSMLAQLDKQLNELTMGTEAAARAAIASSNLTDEEVQVLLQKRDAIAQVTDALKRQKDEQAAAAAAAQKQAQIDQQATDMITRLQDQRDVATGKATKAEIERRDLQRKGYSEEQIAKIEELKSQIDAAGKPGDATKGDTGKSSSGGENKAVLSGTAEAVKIAQGGSSNLEKIGEKQVTLLAGVKTAIEKTSIPNNADLTA